MNMTMKSYSFDVDRIVKYLDCFKDNLPRLYSWNANLSKLPSLGVLTEEQTKELNNLSNYEKELILKKKVGEKLAEWRTSEKGRFEKLCLWIIEDWGGITGANSANTIKLVNEFLGQEHPLFNRIASSSKVGSYLDPKNFIIYDSRVAYSLNWILLSEDAGGIFFPIPEGRNSKMIAFDMNVLIRMKNIGHYHPKSINQMDNKKYISNKDKSIYIPKDEAYTVLNSLMKEVNVRLWSDEKSEFLYYTEMLLFSLADREIFEDITSRLNLSFN